MRRCCLLLIVLAGCELPLLDEQSGELGGDVVPVDFYVLVPEEGAGNELWSRDYAGDVLRAANAHVEGAVSWQLGSYQTEVDDLYFSESQDPILEAYRDRAQAGRVRAVVSGHTPGKLGRTWVRWSTAPILVMRSRFNDASEQDFDRTSRTFLHEIGHNLDLGHDSEPDTSTYWEGSEGIEMLVELMDLINAIRAAGALDEGEIEVSFEHDHLYMPPGDGLYGSIRATVGQCAALCEIDPECAAFTSADDWQQCFLFGASDLRCARDERWNNWQLYCKSGPDQEICLEEAQRTPCLTASGGGSAAPSLGSPPDPIVADRVER